MTSRRVAVALIVVALAATTACGDDDDSVESDAGSSLTSVAEDGDIDQSAPGASDDERCEALRALAEAQPAGNFEVDEFDEFDAAFRAYAEAAERAAEVSEGADRQLLAEFAELMRTIASDPAAPVADEVERLAGPMQDLASSARQQCGVSLGLLPG